MRISIFIDGNNFFNLCKRQLGWNVDLRKLIEHYNQIGTVVDAFYYSAIDLARPANKFLDSLPYYGFVLVSKPLKTVGYGVDAHQKGNLDIEIVMDMFNTIDNYDMAVLVSGDGDFMRPLELLRARGKRFQVLSHPAVVAKELLSVAGMHYVNISGLEKELKYTPSFMEQGEDLESAIEDMAKIEAEPDV